MYMKIAIPTYKRSDKFETISFLKNNNVPSEMIYIFLANEEEKETYKNVWGSQYNWVVGVLGIGNQRNFITNYFDENEIIVSIDDDIKDLKHKDNKPFLEWINECCNYLKNNNQGLISISPSTNPYWFRDKFKSKSYKSFKCGNYLSVGLFHIYKNHKELILDLPIVEDYERSILYFKKYGSTVRYFDILVSTKYWAQGGLSDERTMYSYLKNVNMFLYRHPKYVSFNTKYIRNITKNHKLPNIISNRKIKNETNVILLSKIEPYEFVSLIDLISKNENTNEEVNRIGSIFCPFEYETYEIYKNEICSSNRKKMIVSFGNYDGSIIIDKKKYNDYCSPIITELNYSNNDLVGTKYSLVYFL